MTLGMEKGSLGVGGAVDGTATTAVDDGAAAVAVGPGSSPPPEQAAAARNVTHRTNRPGRTTATAYHDYLDRATGTSAGRTRTSVAGTGPSAVAGDAAAVLPARTTPWCQAGLWNEIEGRCRWCAADCRWFSRPMGGVPDGEGRSARHARHRATTAPG